MALRIFKPPSSTPAPVYPRAQAAALPALMAQDASREHVPLVSLVKDWACFPGERQELISEAPKGDDPSDLCRIAAVVHALCDRDGAEVPDWVWEHRSDTPIAWGKNTPMSGFLWEQTIANAPPACEYHNVWFDYQFISPERRRVTRGHIEGAG